jgi:16S rRNA (guanine1207-N2)-methyltransferase
MSNPALETLILAITGEAAPPVPPRTLFLGAEPHPSLRAWPGLTGWQPQKPLADAWDAGGFHRTEEPQGTWPLILQLPGKSRDEVLAGFATAWELLEPGGRLVAAMANTAGAARFEKDLAKAAGGVTSIQKHKCRAFTTVKSATAPTSLPTEWKSGGRRKSIPATEFIVEAGIFSTGRIDPGSQLLADALPASLHGLVADLGAGWGFLSRALARRCPGIRRIDLFEADARALACAKLNLASSPIECAFHWHDVTRGLPDRYDSIIMNPPFHTGQATDVDLGRAFLKVAAAALKPGGQLWLVANRQLPYEAVLETSGLSWRGLANDGTYKLIHARAPHHSR